MPRTPRSAALRCRYSNKPPRPLRLWHLASLWFLGSTLSLGLRINISARVLAGVGQICLLPKQPNQGRVSVRRLSKLP